MASIFPLFVPAIRDYIDILNNAYGSVVSDNNLQQILQQSVIYMVASIKFLFIYFFSFQWLQDLSYLPVVIPQLKLEILKEHFFLQTPQSNFFTFLEIPSYTNNKFFLGFANSFFLCLPLSVAHIISIRRLLIQGVSAGIFSSLGTICGQVLLLICILFGGRFFITPWFNFQILNYCIGIWVVLKIVYDMAHERSIRIIDNSNSATLAQIFLLNFILAWTEQSCIFQYFGNLTLGAEPSSIEIFSSLSALQSMLAHITYISGVFLGNIFFTTLFIFTTLKVSNLCVQFLSILYSRWIRKLNFALITLIISFTFTSIPFYSFDYLVLSNLGFVSQDKSLKNTLFSTTKITDFAPPILGDLSNTYIDQKPGIDTDIARFNKGRYLMFDVNDSFEQLNYQGEYAWLTKKHRTPTISRDPSSSAILSKVSKFFKKSKKFARREISTSQTDNKNNLNNSKSRSDQEPNILYSSTNSDVFEAGQNIDPTNLLDFRYKNESLINESFENLVNTSASNKFFVTQQISKPILEKKFQQKYYSNPIYKLLLSADIDLFLSRQPASFFLSPNEEYNLFKNRVILSNYYDSLRYYNQLPYAEEFQDFFNGSKTYADRIYNQQFNGTLKIVRRLFSINANLDNFSIKQAEVPFNPETGNFTTDASTTKQQRGREQNAQSNLANLRPSKADQPAVKQLSQKKFLEKNLNKGDAFILKFDQPLYKKINLNNYSNFKDVDFNPASASLQAIEKTKGLNKILNRETDNYKVQENKNFELNQLQSQSRKDQLLSSLSSSFFHEEFLDMDDGSPKMRSDQSQSTKPFIELTNPIPFYVGWDEQLRKLVITNRLSPNYFAGESMTFSNKNYDNNYYTLNKLIQKNKIINFTTWPLLKNNLEIKKENQIVKSQDNQVPSTYNFLFESTTPPENSKKLKTLIPQDINLQKLLDKDPIITKNYGKLMSVPSNIIANGGRGNGQIANGQLQDIIPYTRGGFIWPGHSDLKIKFKNIRPS